MGHLLPYEVLSEGGQEWEGKGTNGVAEFAILALLFVLSFVRLQTNGVDCWRTVIGFHLLWWGVIAIVSVSWTTVGLYRVRLRRQFRGDFLDVIRGEETIFSSVTAGPPIHVCFLDDIYDIPGGHGQIVWFLGSKREHLGAGWCLQGLRTLPSSL